MPIRVLLAALGKCCAFAVPFVAPAFGSHGAVSRWWGVARARAARTQRKVVALAEEDGPAGRAEVVRYGKRT